MSILAETRPDPVAERYFHLRPEQRYKLVVRETEMPVRPGFLKAANTEGNIYTHGALGHVREEWAALVVAGDSAAEMRQDMQTCEYVEGNATRHTAHAPTINERWRFTLT